MVSRFFASAFMVLAWALGAAAQDQMDGTLVSAVDRSWVPVSESLMSGPGGQILMERADGVDVVRLTNDPKATGTLSQGGVPGMRTFLSTPPGASAEGLALRLRGTAGQWAVRLRIDPGILPRQFYEAEFETSGVWQAVAIRFADFEAASDRVPRLLSQGNIRSVELVAAQGGVVDLQLADIGIF